MRLNRQITALVTGVGAIIGYGIIKSLRMVDVPVHIIGMDIFSDAVGQYWCDEFIQAPYAIDEGYIPFLASIIEQKSVDIVFFGTEQEIEQCWEARQALGCLYRKLVVNQDELIEISRDKWLTYEALHASGLKKIAIPSAIEGDYQHIAAAWGSKFILKPRHSYASKGIHIVDNELDFSFYKEKMRNEFMAQKIIGDADHEYTVGVFGFGDGRHTTAIQLKRKLSQEGATAKAETVFDKKLDRIVDDICRSFKPLGPTNLQFRKDNGDFYLLEINPRISSSTSIRSAFGYNEAWMCVQFMLEGVEPAPSIKDGRAIRFIDEVIVKE